MVYKNFQDLKLSALGMGTMRLPVLGGFDRIDDAQVQQMVDYAMAQGVNYYDTAWGYHDGQSEISMGKALKKHPREKFCLATKFPGYDLNNIGKQAEIFEKQLEKCQVKYFDFYLIHNVCELNIEQYLDESHGMLPYFLEQKRLGRIRHLGFSAHGSVDTIRRFLEAYGEHMEFGQLQLNWVDWEFQSIREKAALLQARNIPIWVMEPLRGGSLCKLDEKHMDMLNALRPGWSATEWSFRFQQTMPVTMVLSGMSNFDQMVQNIATFETEEKLTEEELQTLFAIGREKTGKTALPCTACRYCTTHCPQGLDIPWLIELYNEQVYTGFSFISTMAIDALDEEKKPSACLGCRACEAVCPQTIRISEMMTDFHKRLNG